jgi:hypothetical protein
VSEINGWKPPVIYDIETDKQRIATQLDIDRLTAVAQEYGRVMQMLRDVERNNQTLRDDLERMATGLAT